MDVESLTRQLIEIPSPTGYEAEVAIHVERFCTELGFSTDREHVTSDRWNLRINWESTADVLFCSHLDTVPGAIPVHIDERYLYGRGACDAKGIIASMILAGVALQRHGIQPSFLFVVGEETDSIGAKTAAASGQSAKFVVIGEPTENVLVTAHKGVLSYSLTTRGLPAHSGYPERGSSAIHVLLDVLSDIRSHDWGNDKVLGPSTINIGQIVGGSAPNVIAADARCTIVHRLVDSLEMRKAEVREIVADRAEMIIHAENELQKLYVPTGYDSIGVSFGTDVPYLRTIGVPLLVGPGSIHDAHTDNERIEIRQLHHAVKLYQELYFRLTRDKSAYD